MSYQDSKDSKHTSKQIHIFCNVPPPPPPPRAPPLGWASFTLKVLPSTSAPFISTQAFSASEAAMVTNANPRGFPVSLSVGKKQSLTAPYFSKLDLTVSSVDSKERFPTYSLTSAPPVGLNPPLPPGPRPSPPSPLGLLSFTRMVRESSCAWSILAIASSADARLSKDTNPNPRGRWVARSMGRKTSVTVPYALNASRSLFSSVSVLWIWKMENVEKYIY